MKRFNINLPDDLYESLRQEAFDKRVSINKLILYALGFTSIKDEENRAYGTKYPEPHPKVKFTPNGKVDYASTNTSPKISEKAIKSLFCKHGAREGLCRFSKCPNYAY